jgi:hypothetical protein
MVLRMVLKANEGTLGRDSDRGKDAKVLKGLPMKTREHVCAALARRRSRVRIPYSPLQKSKGDAHKPNPEIP